MSLKAIRDRCERRVASLPLQVPFDVTQLLADLAQDRGRPIHLHPQPPSPGPCGLFISMSGADHIFYDDSTTPLHRQHIVLHELGHLLAEHGGSAHDFDGILRLISGLEKSTVERVLGRSSYAEEDEIEAELFASLVIERVGRIERVAKERATAEVDPVVGRLAVALASSPGRL